ncbi:hypothetical protein C8R45DRAFT_1016374, partial [Mycena sanguinolenta]
MSLEAAEGTIGRELTRRMARARMLQVDGLCAGNRLTVVRTARALHGSAERPALRRSTDTVRAIVVLPHFRACRPTTHYGTRLFYSDMLCAVAAAACSESSAFAAAALREDDRDLLPGRRRPRHRSPEQEQELDRPRGRTSTSTRESRDERHGSIADSRRRPPPAVRASSSPSPPSIICFPPARVHCPPLPPSHTIAIAYFRLSLTHTSPFRATLGFPFLPPSCSRP